MYLENSEQHNLSGAGALSAEAMLAEQCQVPKLTEPADFSSALKGSAGLGMSVLVEYTEHAGSRDVDLCPCSRDETEAFTYCNGHAEMFVQYPASGGGFECDHIGDNCETAELSQACGECARLCECFKSSELCATDSLTSRGNYCGHCVEHLQLFQPCEPLGRQCESFDLEPDEALMNCGGFNQCEMSDFIAGNTDDGEELSDERDECFDSDPDISAQDSEPCDSTVSTPDLPDPVDTPDCSADHTQDQTDSESTNGDCDDLKNCPPELRDDDDLTDDVSSCTTNAHVYFDEGELDCTGNECYEDKENQDSEAEQEYELTEPQGSEEECFSNCFSLETKSFTTFPDESLPSDHCSDSSGESDKVVQEDEQTQWESFEEDERPEQIKTNDSNGEEEETPTGDIVIEDYFDFFDRVDYCRHQFLQKRCYISCFDGGDIDACLHVKEDSQKSSAEIECTFEELPGGEADGCLDADDFTSGDSDSESENYAEDWSAAHESGSEDNDSEECEGESCGQDHEDAASVSDGEDPQKCSAVIECTFEDFPEGEADVCLDASEEAGDFTSGESCDESVNNAEDWSVAYDSNLADNDSEECEGESCGQDNEDAGSVSEGDFGEVCEEEAEVCPYYGKEDTMCAPCADDISVEGDAYEDDVCDAHSSGVSTVDHARAAGSDWNGEPSPPDKTFRECSEMEPYWFLQRNEPDVEEYYACEIRSIQLSGEQSLNEFIIGGHDQINSGNIEGFVSGSGRKDAPFTLKELATAAAAQTTASWTLTALAEHLAGCFVAERIPDKDDGLPEVSGGTGPPLGVIHSVASDAHSEASWTCEQSEEEEETSDSEASECCECEYCVPPELQVPAQPLLPRIKSSDAGKICVVLDLDETLVHSSFKPVNNADFIIPVEIDGTVHQVYVLKRPHVDEFLQRMGELFECVLFTASLAKYADPVSDLLDKWGVFRSRLFRESCVFHQGNYVKDLSRLGRDLNKVIILDNSPASYVFHPDNAVPVASWFDDMSDTELLDLIPFFEGLSKAEDVYAILRQQRTTS
ncbi:uncharacterized protein ctdsp1 isoform X1 [Betta splendens]|uniref:protein-serine/threonine phosphatase n=1 Tax=Betta splendens TaxID=158456 RepID=A0A8M1H866_BETSP|nr:uncharacterized protein ctdsp1 isoform X1 [Betta splendens]